MQPPDPPEIPIPDEPTKKRKGAQKRNPLSRKEQTRVAQAKSRDDKRNAGLKAVTVWLTPEQIAYLSDLQLIHRVTSQEKMIALLIDAEKTGVKLVPKLAPNKFT